MLCVPRRSWLRLPCARQILQALVVQHAEQIPGPTLLGLEPVDQKLANTRAVGEQVADVQDLFELRRYLCEECTSDRMPDIARQRLAHVQAGWLMELYLYVHM